MWLGVEQSRLYGGGSCCGSVEVGDPVGQTGETEWRRNRRLAASSLKLLFGSFVRNAYLPLIKSLLYQRCPCLERFGNQQGPFWQHRLLLSWRL